MKFIVNGTFASYTEKILSGRGYYKDYTEGKINSAQFCEAMVADESLEGVAGFAKGNLARIAKMPPHEKIPSEAIFGELAGNNIISGCDNLYEGFDGYRAQIYADYNHGDFVTYVYPEDERLMYAAAKIAPNPKQAFIAGSYYGYLAVWAMQAVRGSGGVAVLSDVDAEVCALARENFARLGLAGNAEICCEDAGVLLAKRAEPIDLLVLDATGRHDDPRPEYRGKRIYGALLREAKHLLQKGSVIYIHNMETGEQNPEMQPLSDELRAINAVGANYDTFNGLGVYVVI